MPPDHSPPKPAPDAAVRRGPAPPPPEAFAYQRPPLRASSARRIGAIVLRHWYLIRASWPRILELAYWPTVQLLIWGLLSQFLVGNSSWVAQAAGVLLGAVLLWEVLVRTKISMTISFLEELWSRNLGNLFVSPMRAWEWVAALMAVGVIRAAIGLSMPILLAIPLFGFNLFSLGLPLIAFFAMLMLTGVTVGLLTSGMILRHGLGAEGLAWMAVFVLAPFSAVYWPVEGLPGWLAAICLALPTTHVFEGMRGVLFGHGFSWSHFGWAVLLNLLYIVLAGLYFLRAFQNARTRGALLQTGE
ncbi:ABC transporter permease [Indioceanicola profundi]|uniref:ABC transporter permease n=1 Tax=Indioceanicola profundi TaxID=2220096 RepID=UPI000E6ADCE0|nr:ABC transporter permease [Indioceanicola profundi]